MTLQAQIIDALAARGIALNPEADRVSLDFAEGQYPLNGFVVVNGEPAYDFVCTAGGGVWVGVIQ